MNRKNFQSRSKMTLRKQSRKNNKENAPANVSSRLENKKKSMRLSRKFGDNITNQNINIQEYPKNETVNIQCPWSIIQLEPYLIDITSHITSIDQKYHISTQSMILSATNKEITSDMRIILVKWIIRVAQKFKVKSETIHICIQLIDHILIIKGEAVNKSNYQLLGICSLFVSSKYNEINTPQAENYVLVCDGRYTLHELFTMEALILQITDFNLQIPTVLQFTPYLSKFVDIPQNCHTIIKTLSNLCVFDFNLFNKFKKVDLALVIIYFASKIMNVEAIKYQHFIQNLGMAPQVFKSCLNNLVLIYKECNKYIQE